MQRCTDHKQEDLTARPTDTCVKIVSQSAGDQLQHAKGDRLAKHGQARSGFMPQHLRCENLFSSSGWSGYKVIAVILLHPPS